MATEQRTVHHAVPIEGTRFRVPSQAIDAHTFDRWLTSRAHDDISGFVVSLAEAVAGIPNAAAPRAAELSPSLRGVVSLLDDLEAQIARVPPASQKMRYGNTAFRTWHAWLMAYLRDGALERLAIVGDGDTRGAAYELAPYLAESFGNPWRIDYGTGHELAFVTFLFCLRQLGLVAAPLSSAQRAARAGAPAPEPGVPSPPPADAMAPSCDDRVALVLVVFRRYVALMRSLQRTYRLEPAGSHGVWGLDDYCFLPFLFGASQFASAAPAPLPEVIHDEAARAALACDNMYIEAVAFVVSVKGARLAEHSPMLNDISGVGSWERIAAGLVRMYYAEVLGKRPVVQLLVFGSLFPWEGERGVGEH
ncbi:hypothetical protein KFE25_007979 [Diacronema lutheri]|uniref:Serine/threonine-protein phosphatase 2A activator n=1 Tax=Diacronema lutheri TaxID=2081491 RepID=A0A8J5XW78_DIALT|nr:hypothetical protein KFE25_007979 [Diacronema lutheri]